MNAMVSWSALPIAQPPRSKPPLRSSSDAPPFPCITPSTVTCVMVVSFMVRPLYSWGSRYDRSEARNSSTSKRLFGCGLQSLRVAGVDVVHARHVVDRGAELERDCEPADDVAGAARHDVDAEQSPRPAVEHELEEAVLRSGVLGARDRAQRMSRDAEVESLLARLGFGQSDTAELGIREDRGR